MNDHAKAAVAAPAYLPFARPQIDDGMVAAVADTLRSPWIASGPQVAAFEKALSAYVGGRPVRTLTSTTGAMEVALAVLGVGAGDEVVTPAQSFFATANVIERAGARTVFVDVDLATRNVDLDAAAAAVTPRTRVLLPVHYNAPLDPAALEAFRARHGVRIVEDAALAMGSRAGGRPVGTTGDFVSFSFHPNKNMTTIEGGALVVNDEAEAAAVSRHRFHGISRLPDGTRDVVVAGGKFNLSDVSARLGLAQLEKLDAWCEARAPGHALLRLPGGRRPAHRRAAAPACKPRAQLEHVHRPAPARRDGDDATADHGRPAARGHRHRPVLRGDTPRVVLARQGVARGPVPGCRAHRPRDGHAAPLPLDDGRRRGTRLRGGSPRDPLPPGVMT